MESKLLAYIITETSTPNLKALESALAPRFDTRIVALESAQSALSASEPDAILLIDLIGDRARDLCTHLRATLGNPLVVIAALSRETGRDVSVQLLLAGADDVFAAVSDPEEVLARLVARRERLCAVGRNRAVDHSIRAGGLCLDLDRMEARVNGSRVPLGPVEFKILCVLAKGLDKLRSRDEIETFVWGDNKPASRALDPHINALRKKINGCRLELRTIYGAGYSLRSLSGPSESRDSRS